jgi:hypothetical protein
MRRDHLKYLGLIRAITLLHQYQRPRRTAVARDGQAVEYIEVAPADIAVANRLAHEVLGRSLDDLAPQTRRLLALLDEMVTEGCRKQEKDRLEFRFTRRDVRERTRWSDTRLKVHLHRLEELEYVLPHRALRGQGIVYELLYDGKGKDGTPFLMGLIEVEKLHPVRAAEARPEDPPASLAEAAHPVAGAGVPPAATAETVPAQEYDADRSGVNGGWSGVNGPRSASGPPPVRAWSGGGPGAPVPPSVAPDADPDALEPETAENAHLDEGAKSYVARRTLPAPRRADG